MWHQYSLTRTTGDNVGELTSLSVTHDDAVMCAHLLAAGFNTMNRNMLSDFALAVIDTKAGTVQYDGKIAVDEDVSAAVETEPIGPECFGTKNGDRVCWRGRNYMPQDEYEADMRKFADANAEANEAARAELISFVKRAHAKKERLTCNELRPDLEDRWRGMLDVLAKFLVVTGEADKDEGHAVARRLCGIEEEMH